MGKTVKALRLTAAVFLAVVALLMGLFAWQYMHANKKIYSAQFHGTYLEHPRAINAFALTGVDEKPFSNKSLHGQWTIIFFGFTGCGYQCPTTMAELGKMYRVLQDKQVKNLPKIIMVSIDPQRDSLDKLRHYVHTFNPAFYAATGTEQHIQAMAQEMGIAYAKIVNTNALEPEHYDIQHSGALMLFNPQGQLNAFFTTPHHAELLAKDYMLLVS